ncbi:MAG: ABC transporter substrate-binding protein [Bosea sp. (in: a-proteobacteria)]|nr:ABC transporter substrate-binding protein [Bosea sp. (in: a-proteobacteria)]
MSALLSRRTVMLGALAAPALIRPARAQGVSATDVLGRKVTLPAPAKRIVLGQGRQINALGLIHPDPVSIVAGWGSDYRRQSPDTFARYQERFPAIETVPFVGDGATAGGFSFEQAITLAPDIMVLSRSLAGTRTGPGDLIERFEAAGIPVAVIDFFLDPLKDTVPSLRLLGRLTGREEQTENLLSFYEGRLRRIAERIRDVPAPSVFIHAHAGGAECCMSPGRGTLDDFITAAGGRNIATRLLPGATGQISLEQLIISDPQVYVATGGTHMAKQGGLVLGLAKPGIATLKAVSEKRAYGLWHLFNDTPLHVVAIERLAKWLHPERFADIDPTATMAEATSFSAIPLDGTLWIEP